MKVCMFVSQSLDRDFAGPSSRAAFEIRGRLIGVTI